MQQRDLIKDQIEQMGKVLGKIVSIFLDLKSNGDISHAIDVSNQNFQTELDIDVEELILLEKEELTLFLEQKKLSAEPIEKIAEYLTEVGAYYIENDEDQARKSLAQALELYEIIDDQTQTMSLLRMSKKAKIRKILEK